MLSLRDWQLLLNKRNKQLGYKLFVSLLQLKSELCRSDRYSSRRHARRATGTNTTVISDERYTWNPAGHVSGRIILLGQHWGEAPKRGAAWALFRSVSLVSLERSCSSQGRERNNLGAKSVRNIFAKIYSFLSICIAECIMVIAGAWISATHWRRA